MAGVQVNLIISLADEKKKTNFNYFDVFVSKIITRSKRKVLVMVLVIYTVQERGGYRERIFSHLFTNGN